MDRFPQREPLAVTQYRARATDGNRYQGNTGIRGEHEGAHVEGAQTLRAAEGPFREEHQGLASL
ncbi:hypothetical protein D9M71_292400 [compost metagenome]